ncbi:uncharacterized protein METZ01_LOCUS383091, partial [marine metagenome]
MNFFQSVSFLTTAITFLLIFRGRMVRVVLDVNL